jgi:hypothetical protein
MLMQEAGDWINLHNEEVFTIFLKMNVSRKIIWSGNMARTEEKISVSKVLVFRPDRLVEALGVTRRIVLKYILKKDGGKVECIALAQHGKKRGTISDFTKCRELLD